MTNFYLLVLFILATYRLTRIVVFDTIGRIIRAPFIEEKYVEEDGEIQNIHGCGLRPDLANGLVPC